MTIQKLLPSLGLIIIIAVLTTGCARNRLPQNYDYDSPAGTRQYEEPPPPRITTLAGYFYFSSLNPDGTGADFPVAFFWDEGHFSYPASEYNPSLANLTLALALSSFASNYYGITEADQARNAIDLLEQIGFDHIEVNHYFTIAPQEDSMGVIAAHKAIEAGGEMYTLIALSTRGSGYGMEWVGNFNLGTEGYHAGFYIAAREAYRFVTDYVYRHSMYFHDNVKLWVTGYSRGGAVANIVAAWLTQAGAIGGISLEKENIFAYTFSTPRGVPRLILDEQSVYTNIHNVLSPADIVAWVAPQLWGFGRYGVDHFIPERGMLGNPAAFDNMVALLYDLDIGRSRAGIVYDHGELRHVTQAFEAVRLDGVTLFPPGVNFVSYYALMSPFLLQATNNLAAGVTGQGNYAEMLEGLMQGLTTVSLGDDELSDRMDLVFEIFMSRLGIHNALEIAMAFMADGIRGLSALAAHYLYESMIEAGIEIEGGFAFGAAFMDAFAYIGLEGTMAIINNLDVLATTHHPEFLLAWLMSQDSNFGGTFTGFTPTYRRMTVHGPADIRVYGESGRLVAEFIGAEPQNVGSHIIATQAGNGEMVVYLPADMGYTVEITATGTGNLGLTVVEFCFNNVAYTQPEAWEETRVSAGDSFSIEV